MKLALLCLSCCRFASVLASDSTPSVLQIRFGIGSPSNNQAFMGIRTAVRNRTLPQSVHELEELLARCISLRLSDPVKSLELAVQVEEQARRNGFQTIQARALLHCASLYHHWGRNNVAASYLHKAESLISACGSLHDKAALHYGWGCYHKERGELLKAYEYLNHALQFGEAAQYCYIQCSALNTIGIIFTRTGSYDTALRYCFQGLELAQKNGIDRLAGTIFSNIGSAYYQLGDNDRALHYFSQALHLYSTQNDRVGVGGQLKNVAVIYRLQKNYPQAIEYFERARAIWGEVGNKKKEGDVLTNLGMIYAESGEAVRGIPLLQQALECLKGLQDTWEYAHALASVGWIHGQQQEYKEGLTAYDQALALFGKLGMSRYENEVRRMIAELCEACGDYQKSLEYRKQYDEVRTQLQGARMQRSVADLELHRALQKAEEEKDLFRRQVAGARRELESKMKELSTLTVSLTEREEALRKIREDLRPLLRASEEQTRKNATRIVRQIEEVVAGEKRSLFQEQFEQVYQEFICRLRSICPDLTPTEIRVCVLFKLGLSNKQIAEILFASPLTVKTHRAHIRRKLGLNNGESLPGLLFAL